MCVLALIGKKLTGPWMKKFYVSAETSEYDHVDVIHKVREVVANLSNASEHPWSLLDDGIDFFGCPIDDDGGIFSSVVLLCPRDPEVQAMIVSCLSAAARVLSRQYQRYFQLNLDETFKKETETARNHNMDAEAVMGMLNAEKIRARNSTICFLSSKLRAIKNHTVDYLDSVSAEKKEQVVNWAVKRAVKTIKKNRLKQVDLRAELSRRRRDRMQKKEDRERKKVESDIRTLTLGQVFDKYELKDKAKRDLSDLLSDTVVGRNICHLWYNANTQSQDMYNGRIEKLKTVMGEYVIGYWKADETQDCAEDYRMKKIALAADIVLGDLVLS